MNTRKCTNAECTHKDICYNFQRDINQSGSLSYIPLDTDEQFYCYYFIDNRPLLEEAKHNRE